MSEDTNQIEVTVAAPVDAVWDALRDKDKIRQWHGWDYEGLDAEIDEIYLTQITEDVQARTLDVGGDMFRLVTEGHGTRVTLTRAPRGVDPDWDAYYDDITEGWITFLQQLRFAVERQPGAARRTLFLSSDNENGRSLADDLGLAHQQAAFGANLVGEDVKVEVWFRSEHQLGVTVNAWGNGLLVISSSPPFEGKPKGIAMMILSTYGLSEAELASLSNRWTSWWAGRYPA